MSHAAVTRAKIASGWALSALLLTASCASDGAPVESRGSVSDGAARDPRPGSSPPAPGTSSGGSARDDSPAQDESGGDECNRVDIQFDARTPTVYLLVDRSSSMFEQQFWEPLKTSMLEVVKRLEHDVEFGFATYTGAAGAACPDLTQVAIARDNYGAIKTAYDAVQKPNYKGETPTPLALEQVVKQLASTASEGPKFILLVTDGEPDFCDDPNPTCSRAAVVAAAQAAHAQGITTFIASIGGMVDRAHLADVANAGVGQPVADRQMQVQYQCPGSKAVFSPSSGTAPYFEPNVRDQQALVRALGEVVAGTRSCTFDLRGKVQILLDQAASGVVEIDGKRIPHGSADGFRMNSATELELLGAACDSLRTPEPRKVRIDFPCESVIVI